MLTTTHSVTPPNSPGPKTSSLDATSHRSAGRRNAGPKPKRPFLPKRRALQDPGPDVSAPPLSMALGPLRPPGGPAECQGSKLQVGTVDLGSLEGQGVTLFQVKRGPAGGAEVRMQIQTRDGLVDATLKETRTGVEIRLMGDADQQPLLHRIAESVGVRSHALGISLDEVAVETGSHEDPSERQGRRGDPLRRDPPGRPRKGSRRQRLPGRDAVQGIGERAPQRQTDYLS